MQRQGAEWAGFDGVGESESALVGQERYAEAEKELLAGYKILMKQTSRP